MSVSKICDVHVIVSIVYYTYALMNVLVGTFPPSIKITIEISGFIGT